jgi:2-polyprenyl-3-methyl-5-hydroxy-6-metoxy-1,4-benzoquinol methylase
MADRPPAAAPERAGFPWQTCLDIEGQDAAHYFDWVNVELFRAVAEAPRRVLELGCSGGAFGAELKARYPGATVVGIEAGRAAAQRAAARLDRVICARIEEVDFAAAGMAPGEFDTVIAADILEHLVNPWEILVRLKPFLAPGAQVVASIPNVRNALLIAALAVNGRWQYRERGLLDITHLRFFTLEEIRRLFEETGYRHEYHVVNLLPALSELYQKNMNREKLTLQFGRLSFADVTPAELAELCGEQFLVRARPA